MNFFEVFRRELTVTRTAEGHYNEDGMWVNGDAADFVIKASVQQVDPEILQTLPEGYRTKETFLLFTETELRTANVGASNADIVTIDNKKFQVSKVAKCDNLKFQTQHFEILVIRLNVDEIND